jgi:flagellar biogenesis protein FliO
MILFSNQRWFTIAICLGFIGGNSSLLAQGPRPTVQVGRNSPQSASRALQAAMQQDRRSTYKPSEQPANLQQPRDQKLDEKGGMETLPLKPPTSAELAGRSARQKTPTQSLTTVFGSLGIVLGLFFLFVWFSKKNAPRSSGGLPREAVEVLGRVPSGSKQHMELVRLGNKLVLLSVTPGATTPLAEVIEPAEVERLSALCREGTGRRVSSAMQALSRNNS